MLSSRVIGANPIASVFLFSKKIPVWYNVYGDSMKKDKRYYTKLIEELGKKIVREKNNIGSYIEDKLKKECGINDDWGEE